MIALAFVSAALAATGSGVGDLPQFETVTRDSSESCSTAITFRPVGVAPVELLIISSSDETTHLVLSSSDFAVENEKTYDDIVWIINEKPAQGRSGGMVRRDGVKSFVTKAPARFLLELAFSKKLVVKKSGRVIVDVAVPDSLETERQLSACVADLRAVAISK